RKVVVEDTNHQPPRLPCHSIQVRSPLADERPTRVRIVTMDHILGAVADVGALSIASPEQCFLVLGMQWDLGINRSVDVNAVAIRVNHWQAGYPAQLSRRKVPQIWRTAWFAVGF